MTRLAELPHATLLAGAVGFAPATAAQAQEIGKWHGIRAEADFQSGSLFAGSWMRRQD